MIRTFRSSRRRFLAGSGALVASLVAPGATAADIARVTTAADAAMVTTAADAATVTPAAGAAMVTKAADAAMVTPGRSLRFPDDEGSHPDFGIEWWYVTGWLADSSARPIGFQITFFRRRFASASNNPSRFAPRQMIVAHAAIADPRRGRLLHAQRIGRSAFDLAAAAEGITDVHIGEWALRSHASWSQTNRSPSDGGLRAVAIDRELRLDLMLDRTQPPLLQGNAGYSRKGPSIASASYYYTLPHLAVSGTLAVGDKTSRVTGRAWLDHEWSSTYMEPDATGWDWIGINLDGGGALMAFQMRGPDGKPIWSGATMRAPGGGTRSYEPADVRWTSTRRWQSPRTRVAYPVAWRIFVGDLEIELEPLIDDQELDARATTGTVYWEGAVAARAGGKVIGRGYLEMTGYWRAFRI